MTQNTIQSGSGSANAALREALVSNDEQRARQVLSEGPVLEGSQNLLSIDALRVAASTGDQGAVRAVMDRAAQVQQKNLLVYSAERAWRLVHSFLREGEELKALNVLREMAPAFCASQRGLDRNEALGLAARSDMRIAAQQLLDMGANPSFPDPEGMTAVMHFCRHADAQLLQKSLMQLESKQRNAAIAALTQTDAEGWMAPMYAIVSGASETARRRTIEVSTQFGFDVNLPHGSQGVRLIDMAAGLGDAGMIGILSRHFGADINSPNPKGLTPLMTAAFAGEAASITALASAGCSLDAQRPMDGATAAHIAAHRGQLECLAALHTGGANLRVRTFETEETPADFARQGNQKAALKLLEELAPSPNRNRPLADRIKDVLAPFQKPAAPAIAAPRHGP